ncbi:sulfotransferase-like domain-containing protein [Paucihalobacter ruber]|uniref:sulfotransferase-like domain-containing protein n=1 Tax=Paucihalobacter ruber TaxID=2567861 RepID=UPI003743F348
MALNSKEQIQKLCDFIVIPFDKSILIWPVGASPQDGCWAKYWYTNVHSSRGFLPYHPKIEAFPKHLEPLLKNCITYYKELEQLGL